MATKFDNTTQPSNSTDATLRAWATFIHDLFVTTGGWVQTADTGQINLGTVTTSASANSKRGYDILRMDDSLQATYPIYLRIDYGTGATANNPAVWITLGTGSDGAGNITNKLFDGGASSACTFGTSANGTGITLNNYGSASTSRVVVGMFITTTTSRVLTFGIERTKDASGADTGAGIIMHGCSGTNASADSSRYIVYTGGTQPANEGGWQFILSSQNPTTFSSNSGVGLPIPMAGSAQNPGTNYAVTRSSDFTTESQFTCSIYGSSITFQLLNAFTAIPAVNSSGGSSSTSRVSIRYD